MNFSTVVLCACSCLGLEEVWSELAGPFLTLLAQMVSETTPLFGGTISRSVDNFQSSGVFAGQRALTIESLPMVGVVES